MNSKIAARIRTARGEAQLSRTKLAVLLGLDPRTVARYEDGDSVPSIMRLAEIAAILEKPVAYFVSEEAA